MGQMHQALHELPGVHRLGGDHAHIDGQQEPAARKNAAFESCFDELHRRRIISPQRCMQVKLCRASLFLQQLMQFVEFRWDSRPAVRLIRVPLEVVLMVFFGGEKTRRAGDGQGANFSHDG